MLTIRYLRNLEVGDSIGLSDRGAVHYLSLNKVAVVELALADRIWCSDGVRIGMGVLLVHSPALGIASTEEAGARLLLSRSDLSWHHRSSSSEARRPVSEQPLPVVPGGRGVGLSSFLTATGTSSLRVGLLGAAAVEELGLLLLAL